MLKFNIFVTKNFIYILASCRPNPKRLRFFFF